MLLLLIFSVYGWVSLKDGVYVEQEDLTASEGDSVNLTIFYVKNDPLIALRFNLLFGGNATGILYTKKY